MGTETTSSTPIEANFPRYRLLDPKFRGNARAYVLQCVAATVAIFLILSLLNAFTQTVLVASLGASSFIACTMPHVESSRPRYLLGGYLVGTVAGCGVSLLCTLLFSPLGEESGTLLIATGALATGLAIFLMVITDTEHPPAAALALGFALNEWNVLSIAVVLGGIAAISIIKESAKPHMMDLL